MPARNKVRIVKRNQKSPEPTIKIPEVDQEQVCKTVVSSWVREHRLRREEFRRNFRDLLEENGLLSCTAPGRVRLMPT